MPMKRNDVAKLAWRALLTAAFVSLHFGTALQTKVESASVLARPASVFRHVQAQPHAAEDNGTCKAACNACKAIAPMAALTQRAAAIAPLGGEGWDGV
eukprot:CAMPEP_0177456892 /NCGR_PEP_ID=MMETSP0369-20130122/12686_1 /TAXON_ID=447022 ORGANISM="Scrippsiella hangoei-like, Strain SHHI-4" /NCGR_SAMPLE_ID=MMETSP0369 /ASSEMBLY_ACC=CAM_ASM_000364 /LENGTH=97 /DNA_ID=CAMNT_0018929867 /DNA_START=310 /DNA_END=604 /DNA_ORIENTATION=-